MAQLQPTAGLSLKNLKMGQNNDKGRRMKDELFGFLKFSHWDLFVICLLAIVI